MTYTGLIYLLILVSKKNHLLIVLNLSMNGGGVETKHYP